MIEGYHDLKQKGPLDILKETFKLYRKNYAIFLKITAVAFIPIVILAVLPRELFVPLPLILSFLTVVIGAVVGQVLTLAICGNYSNEKSSLKAIFMRIVRFGIFSTIGAGIIASTVSIGTGLTAIGMLKVDTLGMILLAPATVLFLWILVNQSLFVQAITIEKHGAFSAFGRSRELVRGHWWRSFGVLIPLALPPGVLLGITAAAGAGMIEVPAPLIAFAFFVIGACVPVYLIGTILIYFDLCIRKEGLSAETLKEDLVAAERPLNQIDVDKRYIRKRNALYIVLGANLFLIGLKFLLASLSGSVAIAASGWMSVENFFLTGAVLLGVFVSVRDARISKRLSVIESVLAIVISAAVLIIAGNMFIKMFVKMGHGMAGHGMSPGGLMYIGPVTLAAIFGAGICYFMSQYKIYIGISCGSTSIEAAGRHCRLHVFMEIAVIIGLIGTWVGLPKLNLLTAAFVLAYVIYTGFTILWQGYKGLTAGYPLEHACHIERNYKLIGGFAAAMLALYFGTGIYTVGWNEIGVVRRFGREIAGAVQPGLHYRLPWPIETVAKVRMDEVREYETTPILLVAGDENIVKGKVGVHYNVKNATDFLFNTQEPHKLLKYNVATVFRDIIGHRLIIGEEDDLSYLLTNGKSEVERIAVRSLQDLMDRDKVGINIIGVQILNLDAPDEVAEAFRDIASAMEEKQTYIHEAEEYRNQIVVEARGSAAAMVDLAEGYMIKKINNARGEAESYLKELSAYQKDRWITEIRLYLETMEKTLPGVKKVFVDGDIAKDTTDLWLINEKAKGKVVGFE